MPTRTVERLDVWSLTIVVGTISFLWGIIVAIGFIVSGLLGAGIPGLPELVVSTLGALVSGLIVGAVTAILYNAAASIVGGLELDLSEPVEG